jgi:hypothetical protein
MAKKKTFEKLGKRLDEASKKFGKKLQSLEETLGDATEVIGNNINAGIDNVMDYARKVHEDAMSQGGYKSAAGNLMKKTIESVQAGYKSLEDTFFTEGKYDPEKGKAVLDDSQKAIKTFGIKAYETLSDLAKKGKDYTNDIKDKLIPTREELDTKYKGIGEFYGGLLFRCHYDRCMEFMDDIEDVMPKSKWKKRIKDDVASFCICSYEELRNFYLLQIQDKNEDSFKKLGTIDKYFS